MLTPDNLRFRSCTDTEVMLQPTVTGIDVTGKDSTSEIVENNASLICLTPVKNEEWILNRFLASASEWADHIVVADQYSEDATQEIAQSFDRVNLIKNENQVYDEGARQRLLLDAARTIKVDGKRILLALDADEMLSANWKSSREWQKLLAAEPGTVLAFHWLNLLPGCDRGWKSEEPIPFGFVDDGSRHNGEVIHSRRLPVPDDAPWIVFDDICVLHLQYIDWARMKGKQRWYQCWERLNNPEKRAVTIFRQYHHMDVAREEAKQISNTLVDPDIVNSTQGVDSASAQWHTWDDEVCDLISEHGAEAFRKLNIWDADWVELVNVHAENLTSKPLVDPRSSVDVYIHNWLSSTQAHEHRIDTRIVQKCLQWFGW